MSLSTQEKTPNIFFHLRRGKGFSHQPRFETEILTTRKYLMSLRDMPRKWIDRVRQRRSLDKLIPDLNSSVSQTYGRQERPSAAVC